MKSFNPDNEKEKVQFVLDNIGNYEQISLATVGDTDQPWAVCVNYNIDENFNFFWKSEKKSLHSQNIVTNSKVGLLIFGVHEKYDFAFYAKAEAFEVNYETEIQKLIDIKYTRKGRSKTIKDFDLSSKNSLYSAKVTEVAICEKRHEKTFVDLDRLKLEWKDLFEN